MPGKSNTSAAIRDPPIARQHFGRPAIGGRRLAIGGSWSPAGGWRLAEPGRRLAIGGARPAVGDRRLADRGARPAVGESWSPAGGRRLADRGARPAAGESWNAAGDWRIVDRGARGETRLRSGVHPLQGQLEPQSRKPTIRRVLSVIFCSEKNYTFCGAQDAIFCSEKNYTFYRVPLRLSFGFHNAKRAP